MSGGSWWHGTAGGYRNHACRCDRCRNAHRIEQQRMRDDRTERLRRDPRLAPHGRRSTYSNWGCRCVACTEANRLYCAPYNAKKVAS